MLELIPGGRKLGRFYTLTAEEKLFAHCSEDQAHGQGRHGGKSPGAPKGNRNAWKHGHYSAEAIVRRRSIAALVRAARQTTDRTKRKEAYSAIHRMVHEDEPYTFLYVPQTHYAWSRRLHNVNAYDASSLPRWPGIARWWVDKAP